MNRVFDYQIYELNDIRKRNIILAIASFVVGFGIALTLLFTHNRDNSLLFSILAIISIFLFTILGLVFLLILNAPITKLKQLIKKEKTAVVSTYEIVKIENEVFSENGISFRKITVIDEERKKLIFHLEKTVELNEGNKVRFAHVNSVVVSYEVLK